MAKIMVSETLHKAIDTAIQLLGARGYSKDTPLEWMYRYARQARLVDGACDSPLFARPSLAAARDFIYQPRLVDGQPVTVAGVRNTFRYRLSQ